MQRQTPVPRLAPAIGFAAIAIRPGPQLEIRIVTEQTKRRDDVLAEILVLVVTPDDNEIRIEVVKYLADGAEVVAKALAASVRRRQPVVIAEFGDKLVRPVRPVLVPGLDVWRGESPLEDARQPLVRQAQCRPMGDAKA
jgi:hypothetical protein